MNHPVDTKHARVPWWKKTLVAQFFPFCLLLAVFISGQVVKRVEDERMAESYEQSLKDQRSAMALDCDARLLAQQQLQDRMMVERDARLQDQTEMIREQSSMILNLNKQVQFMAQRQTTALANHSAELKAVKQTRDAAQKVAREVTDADRKTINKVVGGASK
jgi:hypothetical protein